VYAGSSAYRHEHERPWIEEVIIAKYVIDGWIYLQHGEVPLLVVRWKRIFLAVSLVDESAVVVDTNSSAQIVRPQSFTFLPVGHTKDLVYREKIETCCVTVALHPAAWVKKFVMNVNRAARSMYVLVTRVEAGGGHC
jgi:hypothetical protein